MTARRKKVVVWACIAAALAAIGALTTAGVPIPLIGNGGQSVIVPTCNTSSIATTAVHFFTLDKPKEVPLAFGTDGNGGSITADLQNLCDRMVRDPSLTSGVEAAWGMIPATHASTDAEEALLIQNRSHWKNVVDKVWSFIKGTTVTTAPVPAGSPSLYMKSNATNSFVDLWQGYTSENGTALVFTRPDGTKVELRLDCGFQPMLPPGPPTFPVCTQAEGCAPPPPPPPTCKYGVSPTTGHCMKSNNPNDWRHSGDGGGGADSQHSHGLSNVTGSASDTVTVTTTTTSQSGVTDSSSSSAVDSETGGVAPGATVTTTPTGGASQSGGSDGQVNAF